MQGGHQVDLSSVLEATLLRCLLFVLGAGMASTFMGSAVALAAPTTQSTSCPVAADDVVSGALGAPVSINPTYDVTVDGSNTECLFTAGGHLVLVRRTSGYFDDSASSATVDQVDQLRLLIDDDLDYTPVSGVADAAFFATVHDRSLASERLAVLITKRGADAFVVGVMDTPDALSKDTTLTQAVLDGQAP
jgi:hypothetical protein